LHRISELRVEKIKEEVEFIRFPPFQAQIMASSEVLNLIFAHDDQSHEGQAPIFIPVICNPN
jgi:hypothetical protein